jgi:L-amino acid N-acyltransferase YncA
LAAIRKLSDILRAIKLAKRLIGSYYKERCSICTCLTVFFTMTTQKIIRPANGADAERICAIYNHYIAATTISFEEQAVTAADMAQRIADVNAAKLPWLVMLDGDTLIGYAYATKWRVRAAYRFAVETSVYLDPQHAGKGAGTSLYEALLAELRQRELHLAIGGIAQPNEASVRLHERLGFKKVAHFEEVGLKFGRWIDVGYWQLKLSDDQDKA